MADPLQKQAVLTLLRSSDLFGELSVDALDQLLSIGHARPMELGEVLFEQGDHGGALFVIITGEVRISAGSSEGQLLYLNTQGPGDLIGEIALLDGRARTATATVTVGGLAFCIERSDFLSLLKTNPSISIHLLKVLCSRVRWTSMLLEDSAFLPTEARLAKCLLAVAQRSGTLVPDGVEVRLSQTDLARHLNVTRQVVNRILQQLKSEGALEVRRTRLLIKDQAALLRHSVDD